MKELFKYMNYREYLRDAFEDRKAKQPFYSYRLFSQKAGLSSPNFLKLVVDGKRNLSKESVFKFSKALGHMKKEAEYFENLVFFNQSKTLDEKNSYLTNLIKYRRKADPKKIEQSEYSYYSDWYNPVVRELVAAIDFKDDFKKLGRAVIPAISAADAEKSLNLLLALNFIKKQCNGAYVRTAASLSTGPQVRSIAVANYHKAMIQRASESIERFPASQRDISSLTLAVSESSFKAVVSRMQEFRRELLTIAEATNHAEKVVQVNFQAFPVSDAFAGDTKGRP